MSAYMVALPLSVYVVMLLSDGHRPDVADISLVDAESSQLLGSLLRLRQELNRRRQRVHEVWHGAPALNTYGEVAPQSLYGHDTTAIVWV